MPKRKPSFGRHLIFRSGIHTNAGEQVWPPDRVRGVLDATRRLSPAKIPYTLLHPQDNLPIFGFADRDTVELHEQPDGSVTLSVMPSQFADDAIPALRKGGLDKVSIGLGTDDQIVHIGLVPKPAVAGLGNIFSDAEHQDMSAAEVTFASAELDDPARTAFGSMLRSSLQWRLSDIADWMRRFRERIIEQSSLEEADKQVPSYLIDSIGAPLPDDEPYGSKPVGSAFSHSNNDAMDEETKRKLDRLGQLEAENATLKTGLDAAQNRAAELEAGERKRQITVFLDGIADRVPGSMRAAVEGILEDLQALKPRVFAAADGKTEEKASFEVFKDLLSSARPAVVFGEVATPGSTGSDAGGDTRPMSQRADDETREQIERVTKGK